MKRNCTLFSIATLAALLLWGTPSHAQISSAQVFRAEVKMTGRYEFSSLGTLRVEKIKLDSDDLVNLAMDRTLGSTVPSNEVLALLVNCNDNEATLAVVDKKSLVILATAAVFTTGRAFDQDAKKGDMMLSGNFRNIGPSSWRIEGGRVMNAGKQSVDLKISQCSMKSYSGKGEALLNLLITDVELQGLFTKVSIKTTDNLGIIEL